MWVDWKFLSLWMVSGVAVSDEVDVLAIQADMRTNIMPMRTKVNMELRNLQ